MNSKNLGILIGALVISGISLILANDLMTALSSSDTYSAVIVECASKETRSNNKRGGRMTVIKYAPLAVSEEGHQATGMIWTSSKSSCERKIGRRTSILVNRTDPKKTRINSFLQIWGLLGSLLLIVGVMAFIGRKTKLGIGFLIAFIAFILTVGVYEFSEFQTRVAPSDFPPAAPDQP